MADTPVTGQMLIADEPVRGSGQRIRAFESAADREIELAYAYGDASHVDAACAAAAAAIGDYRSTTAEQRARFLETNASNIESVTDVVVERAVTESGLPQARLTGEVALTTGRLRLFAGVLPSRRRPRCSPPASPMPTPAASPGSAAKRT